MRTSKSIHLIFFFFNDTATTEIYTLSLHDALPICGLSFGVIEALRRLRPNESLELVHRLDRDTSRSEEHTSELQSRLHLVCRLLLEKKKKILRTLQCFDTSIRLIDTLSKCKPMST